MTIKEIARQAADKALGDWQGSDDARMLEQAIADAVAVAVLREAIAFVKARGDVEDSVVAPGMWFAAGYMRHHLLAEFTPEAQP